MFCFAEILKVVLHMTVTVIHFQTFGNILTNLLHHFIVGHAAMCTQSKDNMHILILNAQFIHFVNQNGHKGMRVGNTG